MLVAYCYLEKDNEKVLKFYLNNSTYLEITATFFERHPPIGMTLQNFKTN